MSKEKIPTSDDAVLHSSNRHRMAASGNPAELELPWQEDLKLMSMVASGNVAAMNTVARRLSGRVRRLSRLLVRDETMADDASQIALVEILQSARTYGARSSLERWADRITARITLRHARDERRRLQIVASLDEEGGPEPSSPQRDLTDEARAETPRPLQEYLDALPEAQREALVLKHSLGHTVEEISEVSGVPVGTVKDRLVTARRQVRKLIQRDLAIGRGKGRSK